MNVARRAKWMTAAAVVALIVSAPGASGSAHATPPAAAAGNPYNTAARMGGVPLELLVAVVGAESGYHPWALNIAGRQVYCQTRDEAVRMLASVTTDNV